MRSLKIRKRKCVVCKTKFDYNPAKGWIVWCDPDCGSTHAVMKIEQAKRKRIAARRKKEKKEKKESKEMKNNVTDWSKKLQKKINEIVRVIDKGLPCLARNYYANQYHAGHVFSRGSNRTIGLNLHNIHRQSAQSNHWQNDDGLLKEGLAKEYGQKYFDFVSELRRTPQLKYTNEDYHTFYLHASVIYLKLKKPGATYTLEQRIELRNEVNRQLGIYDNKYCTYNY